MIQKNSVHTVTITDINNLGFGVTHIDGITVFVGDTVPHDVARIKIIKTAKTYAVGRTEALITPSPLRLPEKAVCPSVRRCGGCMYSRIPYEEELRQKKQYVQNAMKKAGASHVSVSDVLTTGQTEGYRNKAQYPFGADKAGKPILGFYAAKTHTVIPATDCRLQPPVFSEIAGAVRDFCEANALPVYDENKGGGLLRHLYLRRGEATGEILVYLVLYADAFPVPDAFVSMLTTRFPEVVSIGLNINPRDTNVILGDTCRLLWGKPYIEDVLCQNRFRISPLSFYQVNRSAAELLYRTGARMLDLQEGETLLDLYCGIGSIGLSMADKAARLVGIEIVPEAVENARENARRNGVQNAAFYCGDASDAAHILANEHLSADAVVVDPPRKGLTPEVITYLGELSPKRILYISCDVDTLARDIVRFEGVGYHTDAVQPVDLFSRTGHCECICLLQRRPTP